MPLGAGALVLQALAVDRPTLLGSQVMVEGASPANELEAEIRAHADQQGWDAAATAALRGYGAELLGFLRAVIPNAAEADEAFSALCESVWSALPEFRFESSCRTWLYGVARNVARDQRRARYRRERRFPGLDTSAAAQVAARVRSTTAVHLKQGTKRRLHAIRDALPAEDRMLLVLRIDRAMAWSEIARVLAAGAEDEQDDSHSVVSDVELARESARLRKRFERVKAQLAEQLRADIPPS